MSNEAVSSYLNDHWAGVGAGLLVARRLARNNKSTVWAERLAWLADQMASDEQTLAAVREALQVDEGGLKRAGARAVERVSAWKPKGKLLGYTPMSRLLDTESTITSVIGKQSLWAGLGGALTRDPRLIPFDFASLEQRALEQLALLRDFHRVAIVAALNGDETGLFS
ncbi:MAG: hypothetical protein ACRDVL_00480 [Acidimicrobiia bacterium]